MKNNELRTRLKTLETKLDTMSQAQHLQLENKEEDCLFYHKFQLVIDLLH